MRPEGRAGRVDLERALDDLRTHIAFPEPPDIAATVGTTLRREPRRRAGRPVIRPGLVAAGIALVACLVVVSVPQARRAVADWLGIGGIRIRTEGSAPTPAPNASKLLLGSPVTLEEARAIAGFDIRLPAADVAGSPASLYVIRDAAGPRVSAVYPASARFPDTKETGVGLLLTQFEATFERELLSKLAADPATSLRGVRIGGVPGYWISGAPHVLYYLGTDGDVITDSVRLAGNTLLWEIDGVSYRLESSLSMDAAIEIAETLAP